MLRLLERKVAPLANQCNFRDQQEEHEPPFVQRLLAAHSEMTCFNNNSRGPCACAKPCVATQNLWGPLGGGWDACQVQDS